MSPGCYPVRRCCRRVGSVQLRTLPRLPGRFLLRQRPRWRCHILPEFPPGGWRRPRRRLQQQAFLRLSTRLQQAFLWVSTRLQQALLQRRTFLQPRLILRLTRQPLIRLTRQPLIQLPRQPLIQPWIPQLQAQLLSH